MTGAWLAIVLLAGSQGSPSLAPLRVEIGAQAGARCAVTVEGVRSSSAPSTSELGALVSRFDRRREVRIVGGIDTPYRCIGGVIFALQRKGFERVTFVSEPAPR